MLDTQAVSNTGESRLPLVLVVDDNAPTANALAAILQRSRFQAQAVLRGNDAIQMARTQRIDAAVVDIHLPDLSGLVVSQTLRELLGPKVPIIVLSGDTSMSTLNSLPHVGATYFFSKPVNPEHLVARLVESLDPRGV